LAIASVVPVVHADQADEFINAFGETCSSFGTFTNEAMGQASRLAQALSNIEDDANCKALRGALDQGTLLAQQLNTIYANTDDMTKQMKSNEFLSALLSNLNFQDIANGTVTASSLQELFPWDMNLLQGFGKAFVASRAVELTRRQQEVDRRKEIDPLLGAYLNNLPDALGQGQKCILAHPNVTATILGQALSLAGAYQGGQMGGALLATGSVLTNLTEYFRRAPFDKAIRDTIKGKLYPALSCGLESITTSVCEAEDARKIFEVQVEALEGDRDVKAFRLWEGIEILSRNMPKLRRWLFRVEAGAKASTPEIAQRNTRILQKEAMVKLGDQLIEGLYSKAILDTQEAPDLPSKQKITQKFVSDIADSLASGHGVNPYVDFFPDDSECFFKLSLYTGSLSPTLPPATGGNCSDYVTNHVAPDPAYSGDITKVRTNLDTLQAKVRSKVLEEKNRTLAATSDPESTWLEATSVDAVKRSNYRTFKALITYLDHLIVRWNDLIAASPATDWFHLKREIEHAQSFRALLESVVKLIEAPHGQSPTGAPMTDSEKISALTGLLKLSDHMDFLPSNIVDFIKTDLAEHIMSGDLDDYTADLFRLAERDMVLRFHGHTLDEPVDSTSIMDDLDHALSISKNTLNVYSSIMGKHIVDGIMFFQKLSKDSGESLSANATLAPPHYQEAAHLCVLALAAQDGILKDMKGSAKGLDALGVFSKNLKDVCAGYNYYSPVSRATGLKVSFDETRKDSWTERICKVHKMNRKTRIYQLSRELRRPEGSRLHDSARVWDDSNPWLPRWRNP
jgi:hypothetical protein